MEGKHDQLRSTEQLNSFHTVHLSSLHAGASSNLSGSTVCNQ